MPAALIPSVSLREQLATLRDETVVPAELNDFFEELDDAKSFSVLGSNVLFNTMSDAVTGVYNVTDEDYGLASYHLRSRADEVREFESSRTTSKDVAYFRTWLFLSVDEEIESGSGDDQDTVSAFIKNIKSHLGRPTRWWQGEGRREERGRLVR